MRNTYPGTCYRCGKPVAAGAGHFQRSRGVWLVQHADCAIKHRKERHLNQAAEMFVAVMAKEQGEGES